ncbi:MAG: phosphate acetyltransferase [Acidiferrobacterales bacterium]
MDIIQKFIARAKQRSKFLVLPESHDERIILAARRLQDESVANAVVLGKPDELKDRANRAGVSLDGISIINPEESDKLDAYAERYLAARPSANIKVAQRLTRKPLFYGGMMVKAGDANAMIAGVANTTARVIEAGLMTVGLAADINTPSSFFLMSVPNFQGETDKPFIYADCAVNIDPTAEELADIALASAVTYTRLFREEPRVALLSFSTKGSAHHAHVDKVTEALAIARARAPGLAIDGELQADSALIARVAAMKVKGESPVAGKANVLIFPNLDAGNIAYKLTQYMAGARAIGPVLQGFAKPVSDLSRGASIDDIIVTAAILLAQA